MTRSQDFAADCAVRPLCQYDPMSGECSGANDAIPTFTDPVEAGPDFVVQGEYVGTVGGREKVAAQVIALSNGKFEGILYLG